MQVVCDGNKADTFHPRIFFGREAESFCCDFSPPPWGRPSSEVLTYLLVLAMVTFVAEATGREFIIDVRHPPVFPMELPLLSATGRGCYRAAQRSSHNTPHRVHGSSIPCPRLLG